MNVRICFELSTRDDDGNINGTFGLAMTIGESDKEIDYQKLTATINKEGVLRTAGLVDFVKSEDVKIITPEEYDEKYGDEEGE